jgi:hypothetical protein
MCSPLVMTFKSNHIAAFALDLKSTYKGDYMIFGLLILTLLRMMFSSFIHLPSNDKISFFFMAELNSIMYKYHIFLIHSSIVGHLGYFCNLAIVNHAAINMDVQVPLE